MACAHVTVPIPAQVLALHINLLDHAKLPVQLPNITEHITAQLSDSWGAEIICDFDAVHTAFHAELQPELPAHASEHVLHRLDVQLIATTSLHVTASRALATCYSSK